MALHMNSLWGWREDGWSEIRCWRTGRGGVRNGQLIWDQPSGGSVLESSGLWWKWLPMMAKRTKANNVCGCFTVMKHTISQHTHTHTQSGPDHKFPWTSATDRYYIFQISINVKQIITTALLHISFNRLVNCLAFTVYTGSWLLRQHTNSNITS